MHAAVAQFLVVETCLLGAFTRLLGHAGDGFALFLAFLNLVEHYLCRLRLDVQIVVELAFDEVADKFRNCQRAVGTHVA